MPKQEAGNIHVFATEELYALLGHATFGTLLTPEQVSGLSKVALKDYVAYKIHVYRGEKSP